MAKDLIAALEGMRRREQAASSWPWRVLWDSCDCGDGYGCPPRLLASRHPDRPGEH